MSVVGDLTLTVGRLPPRNETFTAISAGFAHVCGLRPDGSVRCWGNNNDRRASPSSTLGDVVSISAGTSHTCALRENGTIVCWGDNEHGKASSPHPGPFTAVSAGATHTCGLLENGRAECWGGTAYPPAEEIVSISAGGAWGSTPAFRGNSYHYALSCGLRADGLARCWGGHDSQTVSFPKDEAFVSISVGKSNSACGLRLNGSVRCWDFW